MFVFFQLQEYFKINVRKNIDRETENEFVSIQEKKFQWTQYYTVKTCKLIIIIIITIIIIRLLTFYARTVKQNKVVEKNKL